ncbi:MAG TPA: hypothetical protein VFS31_05605, partial [Chitinophagaceae bacterium]|nr:hypothetical protein [Chitinophagaceae bacterium]
DEGKPVSYYGHERLRTYPVRGGVTVFSRSSVNPVVKASGETLLKQLNWSGLAMIEYLYDDVSDTYKVIEINPRLWGSVMLSEFADTGFLINYIHLCVCKPLTVTQFKDRKFIRWLFPFDVLGYVRSGFRMKDFWKFNKETCFINFSYTSFFKAIYFNAFSMLDMKKVKKIFRR